MTTAPPTDATSSTPTLRAAGRRAAFWVLAAVAAVLVSIVAALVAGGSNAAGPTLGADNPGQQGSRALVEVLRRQGVTVTVANTLDEARSAAARSADPTLFFHDENGYLTPGQLRTLAGLAPRTVVAAPDFRTLTTLAPEVGFGGIAPKKAVTAACDIPAAVRAETLSPGGGTLGLTGTAPAGTRLTGCFPTGGGAFSVIERATDAGLGTPQTLTLVAPTEVFSNETIATYGNAALALGLLGASESLVWYLPTLADVAPTGPPSIGELTPGWVTPTLLLLVVVALAAAIWRGRRFGPLVAENLPVTVKASETMEGRARLYARSSARLRAVDALRIGALQRLAGRVGLPRTATLEQVVLAVSALTGRSAQSVRAVLVDALPVTDRDLVSLSDQLAELERATARATEPGQPAAARTEPGVHHRPDRSHGRMDP
jgi:hypothetical protein